MATIDGTVFSESSKCDFDVGEFRTPNAFRCQLAILSDEDGFSAIVLNLPGVGSCGDTEETAIANAKEAAIAAIASFQEDNEEIPWTDVYAVPDGARLEMVLVNG